MLESGRFTDWLANGVHPLSLMIRAGGPVEAVYCHPAPNGGGAVVLEYRSGVMGILHLWAWAGYAAASERYSFVGKQGAVIIDNSVRVSLHRGIEFVYGRTTSFAPPGTDSGTFDYFVEAIFDENEEPILNAPGIQLSEDDNVLVQGVEGSPYAIGYFGYAYYQENQDLLRAVAIEGVVPSEETGSSGTYPLSRPLFIYSDATIMQEKPQVGAFINYYISNVADQLGPDEGQIGYIPVPENVKNLNSLLWLLATGSVVGGM